MTETRVATTPVLTALIKEAERLRLDQQLDAATLVYRLNPGGLHVLALRQAQRQVNPAHRLPPHHRVEVYMAETGFGAPLIGWLDVLASRWDALPTTRDVHQLINELSARAASDQAGDLTAPETTGGTP